MSGEVADYVARYGYLAVFVGSIVEGDAVLFAGAFLSHGRYLSFPLVALVAMASTAITSQFYFLIARWNQGLAQRVLSRTNAVSGHVETLLARRGGVLMVLSRFLWGFRIAIPVACGITGMSLRRFTILNVAGALVWTAIVGGLGYFGSELLHSIVDDFRRFDWQMALALFAAIAALVVVKSRGKEWRRFALSITHPPEFVEESLGAVEQRGERFFHEKRQRQDVAK